MPWKVVRENDEFCVYKHDADGNPVGDTLGCHATEAEAMSQMKALYAKEPGMKPMMKEGAEYMPLAAQLQGRTHIFIEKIDFLEAELHRETREVDVVLIRPGWSANGRYYASGVLSQTVAMFENAKAFADHPTRAQLKAGEGRSVQHVTGRFYNVRLGANGELRATRKVYDNPAGNAVWPAIVDSIESGTPVIGLSINAVGHASQGKAPDGKEGVIVEAITAVNSVDDVTEPAAGGGYVSLVASADSLLNEVLQAMSFEELIAARPDYVESLKKQMKRERQDEAVRAALNERDQAVSALVEAQTQNEQLTAQATVYRTEVDKWKLQVALERVLREARLHPDWESDIRTQLEKVDPSEWLDILARERKKAQAAGMTHKIAVTGAPRQESKPLPVTEAFDPRPRPDEDVEAWQRRVGDSMRRGRG